MNWIGACIGAFLGSARGGGIIGGIIGAVVGNWLEEKARSSLGRRRGVHAADTVVRTGSDPYDVLGCSRNSPDDEVRKAYHEKAKQYHPDTLRAQGLSGEMIAKANDQMARVNDAWNAIKQERHL
jgi:DnaJ-domain-containing protein 1